ncbi:MAG TPA: GMC family oxidoreductase [Bryobacteraceae bacterium]|nr:GMC family oxidoreductase [Bryobacteraceae bacterium]
MTTVTSHDVVIVGAGVAGSIVAKHLTRAGLNVLLLEAGPANAATLEGYNEHLQTFYGATAKGPESAWPASKYAPQADTADLRDNNGYFVQKGPNLYGSSYSRLQGGSTLHWLGVCLRMLPEDFELQSRFGLARNWPLSYTDLEPYYCKAEYEIGVSADVKDQHYHGLSFSAGYDYPMQRVPLSYADNKLSEWVSGFRTTLGNSDYEPKIRSYPAARNSIPRGSYVPQGAIDLRMKGQPAAPYMGQRCQGNTSCTPICPAHAKYNANKTLAQADTARLQILAQAVASRIEIDPATGMVDSITYKRYVGDHIETCQAKGRAYVLAAHAVENARLMLASGLAGRNDTVGATLMDHPALYAWGLAPEPVYPFRGPQSTSGVEEFRAGAFRSQHAAFRFDVGNDGWRAATGAPDSAVVDAVTNQKLFGRKLKEQLAPSLLRQVRFSLAVEKLPDPANRVTVDPQYLDPLGNPRPVVHYKISEYTLAGMAAARDVSRKLFQHAGITDCSDSPGASWFPSVQYGNEVFHYHGMGHFAGTHAMGASASNSVVDSYQRSWDHRNLFVTGSGSFPTMGTSNPTLTLAALTIRTAEHLINDLKAN